MLGSKHLTSAYTSGQNRHGVKRGYQDYLDEEATALKWTTIRPRDYKNVRVDRIMKIGIFKWVLCKKVVSPGPECFRGMGIRSGWDILPLPSIIKPKPVNEALMEATVRNVRVDGIKGEVCRRTGTFEQALCEVVVCLLYVLWEWTLHLSGECLLYRLL